jgi:hypothetical protein
MSKIFIISIVFLVLVAGVFYYGFTLNDGYFNREINGEEVTASELSARYKNCTELMMARGYETGLSRDGDISVFHREFYSPSKDACILAEIWGEGGEGPRRYKIEDASNSKILFYKECDGLSCENSIELEFRASMLELANF